MHDVIKREIYICLMSKHTHKQAHSNKHMFLYLPRPFPGRHETSVRDNVFLICAFSTLYLTNAYARWVPRPKDQTFRLILYFW